MLNRNTIKIVEYYCIVACAFSLLFCKLVATAVLQFCHPVIVDSRITGRTCLSCRQLEVALGAARYEIAQMAIRSKRQSTKINL